MMKKLTKIIVAGVLGGSVLVSGIVLADGRGAHKGKRHERGRVQQANAESSNSTNPQMQRTPRRGRMQGAAVEMFRQETNRQMRSNRRSTAAGPGNLFRDEMQKAQTEVLAELSGLPVARIEADAKTLSRSALLKKHNISFEEMETVMHTKVVLIVKNALEDGRITKEEANDMYKHMGEGPHGPHGQNINKQ
ncbi:MAG: hypothetical protein H8E38_07080 [SAR324 cluster bacterium]|nr:hypothetical protein [SAR324 cluster bacterium]